MSAHTPGPWKALPEEVDRPYIRIRGTQLGHRYKVANVLTPTHDGVHEREAQETRANARLIAAAPELLEALTAMLRELPVAISRRHANHDTLAAFKAAEAAIAKATQP